MNLSLSPRIQQFLGFIELPKFTRDTTVSKYVLKVKNIFDEKIQISCEQVKVIHPCKITSTIYCINIFVCSIKINIYLYQL